ncbi:MAG TPA: phosphatase PAP2 family protein [Bacteroidaceae bacterium]|nr:phosphatase PAP2 family protein [Bacteroidaceae bacterium]
MRLIDRTTTWLILLLLLATPLYATTPNSLIKGDYELNADSEISLFKVDNLAQRIIPPLSIIGISTLQNDMKMRRNIMLEGDISSPVYNMNNFLKFSPAVLMIGMKLFGVEGISDWNRIIVTDAISMFLMVGIVNTLKYTVCRERPNGSENNSYPSGHTATSFMTATMLHKEYGQTISPWFSVAGYTAAASVGLSRVLENQHWISDVLCGAGIGVFSTELGYHISEIIFGDCHLLKPELNKSYESSWSFSFRSNYCFNQIRLRSANKTGQTELMPGYSLEVEAAKFLNDYMGVIITTGFSQLTWRGSNKITLPDKGSQPPLKHFLTGGFISIPLIYRAKLSFNMKAGLYKGERYLWKDDNGMNIEALYPTAFCYQIETGLNIRTSKWSGINAYIGAEQYGSHFVSFFTGTGICLYL